MRLLLGAGVNPRLPIPADSLAEVDPSTPPIPPICAAIEHHCDALLIELLLDGSAESAATQAGGRSPESRWQYGTAAPTSWRC